MRKANSLFIFLIVIFLNINYLSADQSIVSNDSAKSLIPRGIEFNIDVLNKENIENTIAITSAIGINVIGERCCIIIKKYTARKITDLINTVFRNTEIIESECPGIFVTTSSSISPQFREFER